MASRYMSWCGHRIHIAEAGVGEPLLLIAGLGCNTEMWGPFLSYLPERRIIRYDAPGTGRSSTPVYPVSVAELAELTAAVLDDCGISSTDVIGYSYGGGVAQQLALDHPERIERLVLAATTCGVGMVLGSPRCWCSQRRFAITRRGISIARRPRLTAAARRATRGSATG